MNKKSVKNDIEIRFGKWFTFHSRSEKTVRFDDCCQDKDCDKSNLWVDVSGLLRISTWIQVFDKCILEPVIVIIKSLLGSF